MVISPSNNFSIFPKNNNATFESYKVQGDKFHFMQLNIPFLSTDCHVIQSIVFLDCLTVLLEIVPIELKKFKYIPLKILHNYKLIYHIYFIKNIFRIFFNY